MEALNVVRSLKRVGRFTEALSALEGLRPAVNRKYAEVLHAELLERVGRFSESRTLIETLSWKSLSCSEKSTCHTSLGLIGWHVTGESDAAANHFRTAVNLAREAGDLERVCWAQLQLLLLEGEHPNTCGVAQLLGQIRTNSIRLGDPLISAAIHLHVANAEGKRGLVASAARHARLGLRLLDIEDNVWLRSIAANVIGATLILDSRIEEAVPYLEKSLKYAEQSGVALTQHGVLVNLGHSYYMLGDAEKAVQFLDRASGLLPYPSERESARLDTLACVFLSQGRLVDARDCLNRIAGSVGASKDWVRHSHRYAKLSLSRLRLKEGDFIGAVEDAQFALNVADESSDGLLHCLTLLTKAKILYAMNRTADANAIVLNVGPYMRERSPEVSAEYEHLVGFAMSLDQKHVKASSHFARARRTYSVLANLPGCAEVEESCRCQVPRVHATAGIVASTQTTADDILQDIAALLKHTGYPKLIALDLLEILRVSGSSVRAAAVLKRNVGESTQLGSFPHSGFAIERPTNVIGLGHCLEGEIEIQIDLVQQLDSITTLNAVTVLIDTVRELQQARAERDERLALWPLDELPVDDESAVISGQMRDVMTFARRVAMTNISVLITGESGTGKEILARAIHAFSPRAKKPFIPFNCTAVPREMLESQLFGHRRGAFTSADRDSLGMIRAAREGTLFLDEIGELGLDLQPKLLRFLESGEICPLGEPTPLHVDVRIVAATNQNLDELVRQGRFREDLFYRLNVVRLTIPPLRERRDELPPLVHHFVTRAAVDYGKGRIRVAEETMEHLLLYGWPGNVRQLQNEIRRMIALADPDSVLSPAALSAEIRQAATARPVPRNGHGQLAVPLGDRLAPTLARIECEMIRSALHAHNGRLEDAAKALGISRKGLYLKRQRLGL